jgi:GTP-binding protein
VAISAAHGEGVRALIDLALEALPEPPTEEATPSDIIKVAIVGRPNVGKSTMINALLGEERVIAFDQPGTTRDAIEVDFERGGRQYTLIDTAGLRRRGKVFETLEKFSVIKTLQAIEDAQVVVLVLDARQDISDQDAHIRRLHPRIGPRAGSRGQQVGWAGCLRPRADQGALESQLSFIDFRPLSTTSRRSGAGAGSAFPLGRCRLQGGRLPICRRPS